MDENKQVTQKEWVVLPPSKFPLPGNEPLVRKAVEARFAEISGFGLSFAQAIVELVICGVATATQPRHSDKNDDH